MKKIFGVLLIISLFIGLCFAGPAKIRATGSGYRVYDGYQFLALEAVNIAAVTTSATVFYADNIAGYGSIDFYGMTVSKGSTPTTISAQATRADGTAVGSAQIITSGTDLTDLRSAYYKFTLPAPTTNRIVSFYFLIAD